MKPATIVLISACVSVVCVVLAFCIWYFALRTPADTSTPAPTLTSPPTTERTTGSTGSTGTTAAATTATTAASGSSATKATGPFVAGKILAFKNGLSNTFLARCEGCVTGGGVAGANVIGVHATNSTGPYSRFTVVDAGDGKFGLKTDIGAFMARCDGCATGAPSYQVPAVNVTNLSGAENARFTAELISGQTYAIRADNGRYLKYCDGCLPGYSTGCDFGTGDPAKSNYMQWTVTVL